MRQNFNQKLWILIAIGTGSFMSSLDASVVNTTLPVIREAFNSSISSIQWVVTIYLLVVSGLLLSFGRLGDLRGHKSVFIWGYIVFLVSSALCGAAWSVGSLILFRGIQGIGGAILAANSSAIVSRNIPAEERGRAFGVVSMLTYLGLTVGPSLGGWLATAFSWRLIFYIKIPFILLALGLSWFFIPKDSAPATEKQFDIPGAILFVGGLTGLLLGLNKGSSWGWNSIPVLVLLFSAVVFLIIFIRVEKHSKEPMLDLSLFRIPLFSMASVSAILNYICVFSITFLMPFYLIQGRGMNAAQAGLLLTLQPILMAVIAPISGSLSDKIGSRLPGMIGMAILGVGLFLLSTLKAETPLWLVGTSLVIAGFGTGAFISPNTSALMGAAPRNQQGVASGVQATARNLGMVLGIGLAGALFTTGLAQNTADALFNGINQGFLAAAIIAIIGIFTSAAKKENVKTFTIQQ